MIPLSLIAALLLEQWRPLASRRHLRAWVSSYAQSFPHRFNAGEHAHGRIAWLIAVLLPLLVTAALSWLLHVIHPVFSWMFCVLVLYLTMGFRQFSHYFTDIHKALSDGDLDRARVLLSEWRGIPSHELNAEEVTRVALEQALLAAHHHVFGVMVWFAFTMLIGLGPAGAVLYRLSLVLREAWRQEGDAFGAFTQQASYWIDWLPLRLTAITFAIVGNFEDTIYCWRSQAQTWFDPEAGIVLAAGAGALGVRLGGAIPQDGHLFDRPELGAGDEADTDFMQSMVGLAWRALAFWMVLLLLLSLARLIG
ncbi:MAG: CobD/CbiB family protein [Gallionellaceae bacterium]|jgi:adenosylcobinamide-phosphate synthase|nr:CobD/CbiB family protein [Gallionellaceae bacterium]